MRHREAAAIQTMFSELTRAPAQSFPKARSSPDLRKRRVSTSYMAQGGRYFTLAEAVISPNVYASIY